jgi:hypothetical protein
LPRVREPAGVTSRIATGSVNPEVTDLNPDWLGLIEIQRPERDVAVDAGRPKYEVSPWLFPEKYAMPPTRTIEIRSLPMATVCPPV